MISGAHLVLYSRDAEADRAFVRDVFGFPAVDAGHGWLIFALPPAEVAFHPAEEDHPPELYLMCPDLAAMADTLAEKQVALTPLLETGWGITTTLRLPGGGRLGLYQPKHPVALGRWPNPG